MEATMTQAQPRASLIHTIPAWVFHLVVIGLFVAASAVATNTAMAEAATEASIEAAIAAAAETASSEIVAAAEAVAENAEDIEADDAEDDAEDAAEDAAEGVALDAVAATSAEAAVTAAAEAIITAAEDDGVTTAVNDATDPAIQAATQAAEEAAATAESEFELEDVYATWAQFFLIVVTVEMMFFGLRRRWAFASVVQVSLIVLLVACFALITQQVERDVYEVGVMALMIFTLIQIPFGNIPTQGNFRLSMFGLVVGLVIIAGLVLLSIWLVPYLIDLGNTAG